MLVQTRCAKHSTNPSGCPLPRRTEKRLIPCPFESLRSPQRALPTETDVESGMSQSKSGTSVNLSNNGIREELHSSRVTRLRVRKNVQRFRGGLVIQAHRLLYHSTLGLRVIKKKMEDRQAGQRWFLVCLALSLAPSTPPSIYTYLSIYLSIYLSTYLSISMNVYIYIYIYIYI